MRVGVLGAGSIGAYLGGRLAAAGVEVTLVGRPALAEAVAAHGLRLTDYRGHDLTVPAARLRVATSAAALADCEWVLVTVKGLDTPAAADELAPVVGRGAIVVSFQNGVRNAERLRAAIARPVLEGMVPFNVLRRGPAHLHQGTSGRLAVARTADGFEAALTGALGRAGLPAEARADMRGVLWGKLLINLNNSINALSGLPLHTQLRERGYRLLMADCVREGLAALAPTDIRPRLDPPLPPALLPRLLSLPDAIFGVLARRLVAIDPNARSSMWEDLQRGRPTEVDLLNGEIVRLGAAHGVPTPLNAAVVRLVRECEGKGPPALSATELRARLQAAA